MIPEKAIQSWQEASPLNMSTAHACQDLMLRRLMIEVGSHPYLGKFTALTGGTTLHHAMLPEPLRYSEDLDLLMRVPTGYNLSNFYNAWRRDIAPRLGLMANSHAHTEYPKVYLSWKQSGEPMRITVDLARHPENVITGGASCQTQTLRRQRVVLSRNRSALHPPQRFSREQAVRLLDTGEAAGLVRSAHHARAASN